MRMSKVLLTVALVSVVASTALAQRGQRGRGPGGGGSLALLQNDQGYDFGISLFGVVSAAVFFFPGWKYYRRSHTNMTGHTAHED